MSYMFSGCSSLSSIKEISKWDTTNLKDMSNMFDNCVKLSSLDSIQNPKTENANNGEIKSEKENDSNQ